MLNQYSLCDQQVVALQNRERYSRYAEAARNYRMTTSLNRSRVIMATGRFLVNTGNKLLAIA